MFLPFLYCQLGGCVGSFAECVERIHILTVLSKQFISEEHLEMLQRTYKHHNEISPSKSMICSVVSVHTFTLKVTCRICIIRL